MKVCHKGATSSGRRCATRMMVKANNNQAKVAKVAGVAGVAVTAGTTLAAQVRRREPTHTARQTETRETRGGEECEFGTGEGDPWPRAETPPASCWCCWGPTRVLRERLSSTLLPPRHESIR